MSEELVREMYTDYLNEKIVEYKETPYDEIPVLLLEMRDRFVELYGIEEPTIEEEEQDE